MMGASNAMTRLASELPAPRRAVLVVTSVPKLQYSLKKMGKNPAMTVVAKAEFAQS